ncbi:MAG: hypothetical protein RLZZ308_428 [Candidatus Parcubacteria bacterium]|jgi:hypothetical protein
MAKIPLIVRQQVKKLTAVSPKKIEWGSWLRVLFSESTRHSLLASLSPERANIYLLEMILQAERRLSGKVAEKGSAYIFMRRSLVTGELFCEVCLGEELLSPLIEVPSYDQLADSREWYLYLSPDERRTVGAPHVTTLTSLSSWYEHRLQEELSKVLYYYEQCSSPMYSLEEYCAQYPSSEKEIKSFTAQHLAQRAFLRRRVTVYKRLHAPEFLQNHYADILLLKKILLAQLDDLVF